MTRINTNVASLRGLRSMGKANQMLDQSLTRLSTGLKINSGKDNPSGLIASETLRSQVSAIEQSIKNSNRANNVIGTADSALGEIGGLLTQVRGLVQEGLNSGALSQSEIEANQLQIDTALSAINRISANTTFAGDKLIDGSKSFVTSMTSADSAKLSDFKINEAVLGSSGSLALEATVTKTAEKASLLYAGADLTSKTTLEIGGSKGSEVLFLGADSTIGNIRDAVNGVSDSTGVTARVLSGVTVDQATLVGGGANDNLTLRAKQIGPDAKNVSIEFLDPGGTTAALGITTTVTGNDVKISVSLARALGAVTTTANGLVTALAADATANTYVTGIASEGDGTGLLASQALTAITDGQGGNAGSLKLNDMRAPGTAGAINITFVNGGASQAFGVTATQSGGAWTIAVNLATDANSKSTTTLQTIADAVNALGGLDGVVAATIVGDGTERAQAMSSTTLSEANGSTLALESSDYGSDEFVNVNVLSGALETLATDGTTQTRRDAGTDIGVTVNGQEALGRGLESTLRTSTVDASLSFKTSSNVIGTEATVNVEGGGAVFQIGQEVSAAGQIGIGIEAVNTARLGGVSGKLYELGSGGGKSLVDVNRGDANGADLVDILENAINRVSTIRGRLGAVQKNVIDTNVATLGVALENISEARSQIVDTDFAEETANLTKAQVLSQASISILGIANQNPQQVLSLLG